METLPAISLYELKFTFLITAAALFFVFFASSFNSLSFSPLEAAKVCAGAISLQNALTPLSLSLPPGWQLTHLRGAEIRPDR